jgi:hypothetical protein
MNAMDELGAMPPCGKSSVVTGMSFTGHERIIGTGDMWPLTWADDDNIYAAAGDNSGFLGHFQPMNFWKVEGTPPNRFPAFPPVRQGLRASTG